MTSNGNDCPYPKNGVFKPYERISKNRSGRIEKFQSNLEFVCPFHWREGCWLDFINFVPIFTIPISFWRVGVKWDRDNVTIIVVFLDGLFQGLHTIGDDEQVIELEDSMRAQE